MKKKLLFIIPGLHMGGAEKALINLLKKLDEERYDLHLWVFDPSGVLMPEVPQNVTVWNAGPQFAQFSKGLVRSTLYWLLRFQLLSVVYRLWFTWLSKRYPVNQAEQYSWKALRKFLSPPTTTFDVAIGFLEKTSIYACVDCISAPKKIGFIRVDYTFLNLDKTFDEAYFQQLDFLCANGTLSEGVLHREFPALSSRIRCVENVTFPETIWELSRAEQVIDPKEVSLVTVGRLEAQKGYFLALEACKILVERGIPVRWYIIGEGSERQKLEPQIAAYQLTHHFILVGRLENPYPYMQQCSVYVQTSLYEGKSNTVNEAKILRKPIVVTDFDVVFEQITSGVNGIIVAKQPEAIADALIEVLQSPELQQKLTDQLAQESQRYGKEIEQFTALLAP
jgi:glycosyltransferase involved in cell wall biosynthesis